MGLCVLQESAQPNGKIAISKMGKYANLHAVVPTASGIADNAKHLRVTDGGDFPAHLGIAPYRDPRPVG
jgi:hypothetical protein